MERKSVGFEQLSDIFGFRVVIDDVEDCYRALGIVHTTWPVVPGRFKDYISTPKQNDYRSIHTTVIGPGNQRVELQIRTEEMDQIAELGIAAHAFYKDGVGSPTELLKRESNAFAWLRHTIGILSDSANPEEFLEHTKLELFHDQVFCFTPKGKLIALPRQANVIDFAYAVHTDVGNSAVGCKINGKFAPLVVRVAERRRGRGDDLGGAVGAAVGMGIAGGHRQGAGGDPARDPHRRARSVCRPRPPHRRAAVRARQDRIRRRQAEGRAAAAGARLDRRRDGVGRPRRDEGLRRRPRDVSRLQGRAGGALWRQEEPRGQAEAESRAPIPARSAVGRSRSAASTPTCRSNSRRTAARCRATASSASSRRARASRSIRSSRRR